MEKTNCLKSFEQTWKKTIAFNWPKKMFLKILKTTIEKFYWINNFIEQSFSEKTNEIFFFNS